MTAAAIVRAAAALGFLGVALGAFGAHKLHDLLVARGSAGTWETAVFYQLVHAVALLALAAIPRTVAPTAWLWIAGVIFFSGSLYGLALTGAKWLGPITPLGGLFLLAGWIALAFSRPS